MNISGHLAVFPLLHHFSFFIHIVNADDEIVGIDSCTGNCSSCLLVYGVLLMQTVLFDFGTIVYVVRTFLGRFPIARVRMKRMPE